MPQMRLLCLNGHRLLTDASAETYRMTPYSKPKACAGDLPACINCGVRFCWHRMTCVAGEERLLKYFRTPAETPKLWVAIGSLLLPEHCRQVAEIVQETFLNINNASNEASLLKRS